LHDKKGEWMEALSCYVTALETGKGEFALALALGFVLITLTIAINLLIHWLGQTEREGRW